MSEAPEVVHAMLAEEPLVPGRMYATLCDTMWEHQPLTKGQLRNRFVCAVCHERQVEELRAAIADLVEAYNKHLREMHGQQS